MLNSPDSYIERIDFVNIDKQKQKNYIKYAKGQVTHYKKILDDKNAPEHLIDPGPGVHLDWWEQVIDKMILINTLNKGEKQ